MIFIHFSDRLFLLFQGCLPLVLMFDMKEDLDIDQGKNQSSVSFFDPKDSR